LTVSKRPEVQWFSQSKSLSKLLRLLVPPPGQQPWYAGSAERQQFALLVIARVGARLSQRLVAILNGQPGGDGTPFFLRDLHDLDIVKGMVAAVQAAAQQLGAQPALQRLLEVAAPAQLPAAGEVAAPTQREGSHTPTPAQPLVALSLPVQHMQLLTSLAMELDPLALGLALPGCYNSDCTSLAGASEADMPVKTCKGCSIARWAG